MDLAGYTALVTGGSRGIGRAIVKKLAANGAAVAVNYLTHAAEAEAAAEEIRACGGRAMAVQADVGDGDAVPAMFERIASQFGPVDILVNNAGIIYLGDLEGFDLAKWNLMRRINVDAVAHTVRAAAPAMKARGFGRIVNLSSIAAHGTTFPGNTYYAATKAEVVVLTRRFARDLGAFGITVNAVAPGFIATDMAAEGRAPEEKQALFDRCARVAIAGRVGRAEDVAHAVAFLVSPDSGFITAQVLTVDGGRMDYLAHP